VYTFDLKKKTFCQNGGNLQIKHKHLAALACCPHCDAQSAPARINQQWGL
jgi:hypothetical protein